MYYSPTHAPVYCSDITGLYLLLLITLMTTPFHYLYFQEHLFDVSDLHDRGEPVLISKCGYLDVTFDYDSEKEKMKVVVHTAREIPTKDRGGANNTQIRLLLLPTKKAKYKTKVKQGDTPEFEETFHFKVPYGRYRKSHIQCTRGNYGILKLGQHSTGWGPSLRFTRYQLNTSTIILLRNHGLY